MKKRGFTQKKKKLCKNGIVGWKIRKEDDKRRVEELHQRRVKQMIKSAEGSAGLQHKITMPTAWRRRAQILKKEEEDARLLDRSEAKRKEWAKHWQVAKTCKMCRKSLGK